LLGALEAPVVMVGSDALEVERRLLAGELVCPCGGGLSPWGHARQRSVRGVGDLRPRRARCGSCLVTHVLLAVSCLLRRADGVDVIGVALRAKATGAGHRPIAARLGRPVSTVRGWLRVFARNGEAVRSLFTALLVQLDPLTGPLPVHPGGVVADAVEAGRGVCCRGPPPPRPGRRGVAVATRGGGHRRPAARAGTGGGVDQHEPTLGQRRLINDARDSYAVSEA
jgi:hypothetical protein